MTVRMISVGRSLLDTLSDPERLKQQKFSPELIKAIGRGRPHEILADARADDDGDAASHWLAGMLAAPGDPAHDRQAAAQFADLARAVKPATWPAGVSAEMDTFHRVEGAIPLRSADIAVLVCSDTPPGLLAGLWNATALAGGDLSRIRHLPDPADPLGQVGGAVLLARVKGLDAAQERGFRTAMKCLGTLGRHLLDSPDVGSRDAFRFYLSGGFKAAIPYLIGLAEGLRSASTGREVDAYVLHETRNAAAIRLPLRRMVGPQVAEELSEFDEQTGTSKTLPKPALLYGYAYEAEGPSYKLTPFGEGLRALFPARQRINP